MMIVEVRTAIAAVLILCLAIGCRDEGDEKHPSTEKEQENSIETDTDTIETDGRDIVSIDSDGDSGESDPDSKIGSGLGSNPEELVGHWKAGESLKYWSDLEVQADGTLITRFDDEEQTQTEGHWSVDGDLVVFEFEYTDEESGMQAESAYAVTFQVGSNTFYWATLNRIDGSGKSLDGTWQMTVSETVISTLGEMHTEEAKTTVFTFEVEGYEYTATVAMTGYTVYGNTEPTVSDSLSENDGTIRQEDDAVYVAMEGEAEELLGYRITDDVIVLNVQSEEESGQMVYTRVKE